MSKLPLWVVCLALLGAPAWVLADNFYRYTNEQGSVVVDFRIPPKYVPYGYEILNNDGMVIEVVPAQPDVEQRDTIAAQREREASARVERERLREWDESLLRRYSTVSDIESARDRALRDLKIRVSILKSNRRSLRQKIENAQARVAEAERVGREPLLQDLDIIDATKADIDATERSIAEREQQIENVYADYDADIERFKQLQEVVELRRSLETPRP